jgi:DNA adenine methylase
VEKIKKRRKNGQKLFDELVNVDVKKLTKFKRAVRFFILNRITFSGIVESGGYSQLAFETRFTDSSIERLSKIGQLLDGVKITRQDYSKLLEGGDKNTFTFLDPPYFKTTKSKLYGKNGILHTDFDHDNFACEMKKCNHSWLITYDDSRQINKKFTFAYISKWKLQYGMNNYKQGKAKKGKELFITNYRPPHLAQTENIDNGKL